MSPIILIDMRAHIGPDNYLGIKLKTGGVLIPKRQQHEDDLYWLVNEVCESNYTPDLSLSVLGEV